MGATVKTKLVIAVFTVLLLVVVFLLKSLSSKNTLSPSSNYVNIAAQTEILEPSVKSGVTNKAELVKETDSLKINAKVSNSNKVPVDLGKDMGDLEEFIIDEIGDEVRTKLGRHAFEREIVEMTDHPESVYIKFEPETSNIRKYECFSKLCDENGNIIENNLAITASHGIRKYEIIDVNEDKGTYTVRESIEGEVVKTRKNFHLSTEKIPPLFEKTYTYRSDGTVLKVEQKGRDVTSLYQNVPCLVFPQKELQIGDSWICGGEQDTTWKIKASVSGFVRVSGQPCVVISFDETQKLSIPGVKASFVERTGKKYYSLDKYLLLHSEYIETTEGKFGPLNEISNLVVWDLMQE